MPQSRDARGRFIAGSGSSSTSGSVRIVDRDRGYQALKSRLFARDHRKVAVGILTGPDGHADEEHQGGPNGARQRLIDVAIPNEFGGPNGNDPPERSFIRDWFDAAEPRLRRQLVTLMQGVIKGTHTKEQILKLIGLQCVGEIQQRIADSIDPPNAPATVRRKGSSTPLINRGQLRAGVTSALRDEGEDY